jgi:ribosome maturation factor RimP
LRLRIAHWKELSGAFGATLSIIGGHVVDAISQVLEILTPPLKKAGYELAEVKLTRDNEGLTLHIYVDRDAPISLDDIVKVSDLINPLLDEADPIAEPYTLDVSSLGSEKPIPLDRLEHYLHYHVNLHLSKPHEGQNILEGDLEGVTLSEIKLLVAEKTRKKEISLPRGDVDKARLAIKF